MERAAKGEYSWALTMFPTHAYAAEAEMSLADYEDFYFAACLADEDDPVAAWSKPPRRSSAWPTGSRAARRSTSRARGPTSRLASPGAPSSPRRQAQHARRRVLHRAGRGRGRGRGHLPPAGGARGREVAGVRLRFEGGKVVDASAERGEEFLIKMLDTDDGARLLGELGIGTNYGIETRHRRSCSTRRSAAPSTWRSAKLSRDRRQQRVSRAQGHGLRPAPGRQDHRRRRAAAGGRRFVV